MIIKEELPGQTNRVNKIRELYLRNVRKKQTTRDFGSLIEGYQDANYPCVSELPFKNSF